LDLIGAGVLDSGEEGNVPRLWVDPGFETAESALIEQRETALPSGSTETVLEYRQQRGVLAIVEQH
jgi:hypothetical protein